MFDILCAAHIYCAPPKPIDPPDGHVMIAGLSGREHSDPLVGAMYYVSTTGPSVVCGPTWSITRGTSDVTYSTGGGGPVYVESHLFDVVLRPPDPGDGPG